MAEHKLTDYFNTLFIKEEDIPEYDKEDKEDKKDKKEDDEKSEKKEDGDKDDEKAKKEAAKEVSNFSKKKIIAQLDSCNDKDLEDVLYAVLDAKSALKKKKIDGLVKDRDDKCASGCGCGESKTEAMEIKLGELNALIEEAEKSKMKPESLKVLKEKVSVLTETVEAAKKKIEG